MNLTTLLFLVGFPIWAPLALSAALWRKLERPWLFLFVIVLSVYAIADISLAGFREALVSQEAPPSQPAEILHYAVTTARQNQLSMLLADAIAVLLGTPLVVRLFSVLRRLPA